MFRPALARVIGFEAGNLIFVSLNDRLLICWLTRSGPGVAPRFETKQLDKIFRHNVFKMLLSEGKITQDLVNMLMSWPLAQNPPYHVHHTPDAIEEPLQFRFCLLFLRVAVHSQDSITCQSPFGFA